MMPFNKPFLTGKETIYIEDAVQSGKISGNGKYTKLCQQFFEDTYGFKKSLMTTSCTDALEMCAMLIDVRPGDEVIVPSYTFVSSALAFVRQGAKIVFADSRSDHPGIDESKLSDLITSKTKAIVVVHYAGVACDMEMIMKVATKHNIFVIEDAAQAIDSYYKGEPLGSIGHLGAFSFHETKNIISGEGGMLAINDDRFVGRSEIIWEKGTNRSAFFKGEIDKYGWVDTGSSFLPSELISAFLYAQLENLATIQKKRKKIWQKYKELLLPLQEKGLLQLAQIPNYASNNAHMFYVLTQNSKQREELIRYLKERRIYAVFHYLALHKSDYHLKRNDYLPLKNAETYSDTLLRMPFYYELSEKQIKQVCEQIFSFFKY